MSVTPLTLGLKTKNISFIHIILVCTKYCYHCSTSNAYAALNQLYSDDIVPSFSCLYIMTQVHTCTTHCIHQNAIYGVRKVRLPKQQEQIACWLACSAHSKAHIAHSCVVVVSYVRKQTYTPARCIRRKIL